MFKQEDVEYRLKRLAQSGVIDLAEPVEMVAEYLVDDFSQDEFDAGPESGPALITCLWDAGKIELYKDAETVGEMYDALDPDRA